MSKMTFTSPRATFEETLAFANAVREAGGGNPLDALMPAIPQDASQCLIAKNLNFNCEVSSGWAPGWSGNRWYMATEPDIAKRIGEALGLVVSEEHGQARVMLPDEIGQVANDFDDVMDFLAEWTIEEYGITEDGDTDYDNFTVSFSPNTPKRVKEMIKEFWPYIEASYTEAIENATFINEKGELVL